MGWEDTVEGRQETPDEIAESKERDGGSESQDLSPVDAELFERVRLEMSRAKPHLHVVFVALLKHADVFKDPKAEDPDFRFSAYRGFLSDLSKKLGITENGVKYRARAALKWFVKRARKHLELQRRRGK